MMALLPTPDFLLQAAAWQFGLYGLAWVVYAAFVKIERHAIFATGIGMLVLALLCGLGIGKGAPAWPALLALLLGFALNVALVIHLLRRFTQLLLEHSRHDELTGLANRRALDRALLREWRRLQRGGNGFAVLAMDLDHFKEINDRYGHPSGDQVLVQVAGRLKRATRDADVIARVGGEEFNALVHDSTAEGALVAAERLRVAVAAAPYAFKRGVAPITLSVGVAIAGRGDAGIADVLERADRALYQAKRSGRNRVCLEPDRFLEPDNQTP